MCGRGRPRVHGVSRAHVRLPCQKQGRTHLGWARKRGGTHLGWVRKQGGLHPRFGIYGTEQASPAPEDAPCFLVPASPHFGPARPIHLKSASWVRIGTYPLGRAGRPYASVATPKPHPCRPWSALSFDILLVPLLLQAGAGRRARVRQQRPQPAHHRRAGGRCRAVASRTRGARRHLV